MFEWWPCFDLDIFDGKVKFAFRAFIREEFMELVEDLGAEVNKYIQRNKYMNIVLQYR